MRRSLARAAALPWAIAVGQDLRQPTSTGEQNRMQRLTSGWVRELGRQAAHGSLRAQLTVNRLYHMVGSPAALLSPALIAAAAPAPARGAGGRPAPRPAALDVLAMVEDEPPGPSRPSGSGAARALPGPDCRAPVRRPISAGSRPPGGPDPSGNSLSSRSYSSASGTWSISLTLKNPTLSTRRPVKVSNCSRTPKFALPSPTNCQKIGSSTASRQLLFDSLFRYTPPSEKNSTRVGTPSGFART